MSMHNKTVPMRMHPRHVAKGFTLIEAMVALTIGLALLLVMSMVFVRNGSYRNDLDRSSRMIENAAYGMQAISGDILMAGYYAELDWGAANGITSTATWLSHWSQPTNDKPDACAVSVNALNGGMAFAIDGYDGGANLPSSCTSGGSAAVLADRRSGSDVLVVRHADTCAIGAAGCDVAPGGSGDGSPYFQASQCTPNPPNGQQLTNSNPEGAHTGNPDGWYVLDTDLTRFTSLQTISCNPPNTPAVAEYYHYVVDIYFVTNNDNSGDGIPTLKVARIGNDGAGATRFNVTPVAEGIETMQIEYGLDTSVPSDGIPDVYTADPDSYPATSPQTCTSNAQCLANWTNVVTAKVHLLGRNTEATPLGYTNDKVFTLGLKLDGTTNTFPASGTFGDGFKRHVYEATVRLNNPAGRRQS